MRQDLQSKDFFHRDEPFLCTLRVYHEQDTTAPFSTWGRTEQALKSTGWRCFYLNVGSCSLLQSWNQHSETVVSLHSTPPSTKCLCQWDVMTFVGELVTSTPALTNQGSLILIPLHIILLVMPSCHEKPQNTSYGKGPQLDIESNTHALNWLQIYTKFLKALSSQVFTIPVDGYFKVQLYSL